MFTIQCTVNSLHFTVYRVVDKVKRADIVVYIGVNQSRHGFEGRDADKGRGVSFTRFCCLTPFFTSLLTPI